MVNNLIGSNCFLLNIIECLHSPLAGHKLPAKRVRLDSYTKSPFTSKIEMFKLYFTERERWHIYYMAKQHNTLAHTRWMCKYHIVFIPKYRRKVIYNQLRKDISSYITTLCKYKGVQIIEGHMMKDHVHLILSIPPKMSVSSFMGYLKGKSSLMIFDNHANLKYKFGNRRFWAEGFCGKSCR